MNTSKECDFDLLENLYNMNKVEIFDLKKETNI